MRITKTFFFAVNFLAASSICLAQATIFHDISQGNKKAVKAWIKSKPDLMVLNDQGQTVLHVAVQSGNRKIVKMLTKAGVGLNILDKQGKTALDHAVEVGHVKISYDLVKKKALIACAYNQQPLKKLIIQRTIKLYTIFIGIGAVGLFLLSAVTTIPDAIFAIICSIIPGILLTTVGISGIVDLITTSGVCNRRSYLMNQNI